MSGRKRRLRPPRVSIRSLDLALLPSFWNLPRRAHEVAVAALHDANRARDAAALTADHSHALPASRTSCYQSRQRHRRRLKQEQGVWQQRCVWRRRQSIGESSPPMVTAIPRSTSFCRTRRMRAIPGFELGPLFFLGEQRERHRCNTEALSARSCRVLGGGAAGAAVRWRGRSRGSRGACDAQADRRGCPDRERLRRSPAVGDAFRGSTMLPATWWSDDDWAEVRRSFIAIAALGR